MKRHFALYPLIFLLPIIISCTVEEKDIGNFERIAVEKAFKHPKPLKASDCFEKVRYVALETSNNCLVGNAPRVRLTSDRIIVMTSQHQCLAFDKQTGKFLHAIGHIGNDPEACGDLYGWLNEASRHLYFPAPNPRQMTVYDIDNHFIRRQKVALFPPPGSISPLEYDYLDENTLLAHAYASQDTPAQIAVIRNSTVISTFPTKGEPANPHVPQLGISTEYFSIETEGTGGHKLYIILEDDKCSSIMIDDHGPFWHLGKETFFKEHFNDTIYKVTANGLQPKRWLDFGTYQWPLADRYHAEKDKGFFPVCFMENKRIILFRFCQYLYHSEKRKAYNAIYNKQTGTVQVAPYEEGLLNDLGNFMPLQPTASHANGEFAQVLQPDEILAWFEEHPSADRLSPDIDSLRTLDWDANPVIAIMQ